MRNLAITSVLLSSFLLLWSVPAAPKGADGFVSLKGTIENATVSDQSLTFQFTGEFSFISFTAPPDEAGSQRIEQRFRVKRLPVRIPRWETTKVAGVEGPFVVNFENASIHAAHVSRTGEAVGVALFRPIISYDSSGSSCCLAARMRR